ncbi:MAG: transporter substrate-binding domain-containing protein [Rhodocyclaceae bacterium]|nr:transporter substrate-binding domain-containing protein [Rhodocyclaceae bacterium]MBX3668224.1 transporter substrate-binding domain-containing protein [Rhodocyclaceae bacterium]
MEVRRVRRSPAAGALVALRLAAVAIAGGLAAAPVGAQCTQLVMSAHPDYPPYQWKEEDRIVGASVDIAGRILDELGVKWQADSVGPWKRVLKSAENGQIDMILSLRDTPERRNFLQFTGAPSFPNPTAVFMAAARRFDYHGWPDLRQRRGGIAAGDKFGEEFDRYAAQNLSLEETDTPVANFHKLAAGRLDFVLTGLYTGRAQLAALRLEAQIVALQPVVNSSQVHLGFALTSACRALIPKIDARLREFARDGTSEAALERNLVRWKARSASVR